MRTRSAALICACLTLAATVAVIAAQEGFPALEVEDTLSLGGGFAGAGGLEVTDQLGVASASGSSSSASYSVEGLEGDPVATRVEGWGQY